MKAYLRRAAARVGLQHLAPALEDYRRVLQLEPTNKQARTEIERLEKVSVFLLAGNGGWGMEPSLSIYIELFYFTTRLSPWDFFHGRFSSLSLTEASYDRGVLSKLQCFLCFF